MDYAPVSPEPTGYEDITLVPPLTHDRTAVPHHPADSAFAKSAGRHPLSSSPARPDRARFPTCAGLRSVASLPRHKELIDNLPTPLIAMLFLLQIILFACFVVTLVQVIFDFAYGSFLILTGFLLMVYAYMLKLLAWIIKLHQRYRRPWGRRRFWFVRP